MKRLSTLFSERKKESCRTFIALLSWLPFIINEMFVSDAPCAQAMTLMPLLPREPKSFPAMPGVCFIFSPTIATVASSFSTIIGYIDPV